MRRLVLGMSVVSCLFAAGCSPEAPPPVEQVRSSRLGIFNGSPDTEHTAVIALFGNSSVCSGTIVAVDGADGYVLTAGHCVEDPPVQVAFTDDYNDAPFENNVVSYAAHPGYDSSDLSFDFAMVKFSGANGSTPIIPAMTDAEDNLVGNEIVEFVGYGITENNNNNSVRMHVSGPLSNASAFFLEYDQASGGPCSGDSGGPSLSLAGGQERVSGVTSYGDQDCVQYGVSGRVSAVYDSFILPFIEDGGMGGMTCNQCQQAETAQNGDCGGAVDACIGNNACLSLAQCIDGCNDQACVDDCANDFPGGIALYNAIFDCICVACATECAAECGTSSSSSTTTSSSSTTASSSGSGATTSSSGTGVTTGAGGAGATSTGVGANGSSGAGNDDDDDDDKDSSEEGGCSVGATGATGGTSPVSALGILGLLGLLAGIRRRR